MEQRERVGQEQGPEGKSGQLWGRAGCEQARLGTKARAALLWHAVAACRAGCSSTPKHACCADRSRAPPVTRQATSGDPWQAKTSPRAPAAQQEMPLALTPHESC